MKLNLYHLIVDSTLVDYDCYSDQVVAATSEQEARELCEVGDEATSFGSRLLGDEWDYYFTYPPREPGSRVARLNPESNPWLFPQYCQAKLLGTTDVYDQPCVVCSSFHAG